MKRLRSNKSFFYRRIILLYLFTCIISVASALSQNLLNLDGWTIGQGSTGIFTANGQASENIREWGEGPHGKRVILWKAQPEGAANDDGGWNGFHFNIDHSKMYRFSVWIKKTNSLNGVTYFGCHHILDLNGSENTNPYFWYGKLPQIDKWYLLVGYIHGSGDPSTTSYGGVYDGASGIKVLEGTDFKSSTQTTITNHRSYLFYDPNINDRQYFYAPRVDEVNGNEPSIETLLGLNAVPSGDVFFSGKVGIQTQDPKGYELAVNGKVRAREIKVEAANWPDYVFAEKHKLPLLEDIESFIQTNSHLPEIPNAAEAGNEGIGLGEMNAKLLKKIEELTLYLIQQNKEMKALNSSYQELKQEMSNLKAKQ